MNIWSGVLKLYDILNGFTGGLNVLSLIGTNLQFFVCMYFTNSWKFSFSVLKLKSPVRIIG